MASREPAPGVVDQQINTSSSKQVSGDHYSVTRRTECLLAVVLLFVACTLGGCISPVRWRRSGVMNTDTNQHY